jgi:hypothetical protein
MNDSLRNNNSAFISLFITRLHMKVREASSFIPAFHMYNRETSKNPSAKLFHSSLAVAISKQE